MVFKIRGIWLLLREEFAFSGSKFFPQSMATSGRKKGNMSELPIFKMYPLIGYERSYNMQTPTPVRDTICHRFFQGLFFEFLKAVAKQPPDLTYHIMTIHFACTTNLMAYLTNSSLLTLIKLNSAFKYVSLMHSGAYKLQINKQNQRELQTFKEIIF